ncbi:PilN domain-containing protein [Jinshanibacter sp. LJY008]|uniref:PilN domain-containing protein n=1 Tax=Limnobaculum eriocheiris TaxID=2897391 RepID=A0A9X1MYL1_9GAMM|nr:PilN domain-containing protein [Limnobaculum eriocheiris]MCD1126117.1 PilN domain-containing protein [Limnobaculum eriocheiris]
MLLVNFLPWRAQRQKKAIRQFVIMALCYAVATFFCISSLYLIATDQREKLSVRLADMTASNTAMLNDIKQIKDIQQAASNLALLQSQTQQIRQQSLLLQTLFADIELALPESLWLKKITFQELKLVIEGQGHSYLNVMDFQRKLDRSSLISGLQLGKMMAVDTEFSLFSFIFTANRTGVEP